MANNASVLDFSGKSEGQVALPPQFDEPVRPDLISRAAHAQFTLTLQPKGAFPLAGMATSAEYFGRRHEPRQTINTGRSRLPREKLADNRLGRVRQVPHSVTGRRAHPPKPYTVLVEKINFKEKMKAIRSAIAATADDGTVRKRGHKFSCALPIVVDSNFESIKKSGESRNALEGLGLSEDLRRAREGRRMRSGRARLRKGGYRSTSSVLIVYGKDSGVWRATRNIPGVDAVAVEKLDVGLLAPGGVPGRLTVWTRGAIEKLGKERLYL
ncbi:50S ribosomal protein L4 [Candidatus Micrarchaeota archaeon]|nr:50S ribosomal protein L4 [Candidatus Micrarchaeota archaeon]MBI5177199.1 50S ribosomal protein L4 [Candidatus Micrarchaeota archaeon]